MDERLVFLIILFAWLLLKGLSAAVLEQTWTAVRIRKFYAYLTVNVLIPILIFGFYSEFASARQAAIADSTGFTGSVLFRHGLVSLTVIYLLAILSLFLSWKTWPFNPSDKTGLKTLLMAFIVVFVVELVAQFLSGSSINPVILT